MGPSNKAKIKYFDEIFLPLEECKIAVNELEDKHQEFKKEITDKITELEDGLNKLIDLFEKFMLNGDSS